MPIFGLGTWQAPVGEVGNAVEMSLKAGYRHIDCAAFYCNEAEIGDALAKAFSEGLVKREDVWITSKLWNTKHAKDDVIPALKQTLSDLKLAYLDLYLIHFPMAYANRNGELFPMSESGELIFEDHLSFLDTWKMLEQAKKDGLVKNIGFSNFNSVQIQSILDNCEIKPSVLQVECHPYLPQLKLKEFAEKHGLAFTAYSPLGSPAFSVNELPETPKLLQEPKLVPIAEKHNKTVGQILLRYQIERGNSVIPKSSNEGRIKQNIDVFNFKLDSDDMNVLNNIGTSFRYVALDTHKVSAHYPFGIEY